MLYRPFTMRCLITCCALALLAVLIAMPVLTAAPFAHDSFWIDYMWVERFAGALRQGALYPRWLDGSFDGLGAPVFYFYAPLPFYVAGVASLAGAGAYHGVLLSFLVALFGSGVAMHGWLRDRGAAFAGAALYMAMPYHLIDFALRGALGEFCATAFLPVIAIGIDRAVARRGSATLALGYAGLILCHLPTALLASVALIAPYALHRCRGHPRAILRIVAALTLGIGLAAVYLVPAIALQPASNMAALWKTGYRPSDWSLLNPATLPDRAFAIIIVAVAVVLAGPALWAIAATRRMDFWALTVIVCCALALGLVPFVWRAPLLNEVQFPWRILTVAEFAVVTLLAERWRRLSRWPAVALVPAVALSLVLMRSGFPDGRGKLAEVEAKRPEVLEYLSAGTHATSLHQVMAFAASVPERRASGGVVTVRRFGFPGWVALCGGRSVPTGTQPGTGLLTYRGPPDCQLVRTPLTSERVGFWLSVVASLSLIVGLLRRLPLRFAFPRRLAT